MRHLHTARFEQAHSDCTTEPVTFASRREADAVLLLHASHPPDCRRYLAACAYASAGLDEDD